MIEAFRIVAIRAGREFSAMADFSTGHSIFAFNLG